MGGRDFKEMNKLRVDQNFNCKISQTKNNLCLNKKKSYKRT